MPSARAQSVPGRIGTQRAPTRSTVSVRRGSITTISAPRRAACSSRFIRTSGESVAGFPPQEIGYYLAKVREALTTDLATLPFVFKTLTYRVFRYGFLNDVGLLNSQVSVDAKYT